MKLKLFHSKHLVVKVLLLKLLLVHSLFVSLLTNCILEGSLMNCYYASPVCLHVSQSAHQRCINAYQFTFLLNYVYFCMNAGICLRYGQHSLIAGDQNIFILQKEIKPTKYWVTYFQEV